LIHTTEKAHQISIVKLIQLMMNWRNCCLFWEPTANKKCSVWPSYWVP